MYYFPKPTLTKNKKNMYYSKLHVALTTSDLFVMLILKNHIMT